MNQVIEIAVGILKSGNEVLLSQRQPHQDLAGYWEFPGGKITKGESPEQALEREFFEEVGIVTTNWQALIQIPWEYEDKKVLLQVYQTTQFSGEVFGKEGQKIQWCIQEELKNKSFPQANKGILTSLALPKTYVISGHFDDEKDALFRIKKALDKGEKLLQLRAKSMDKGVFVALAKKAVRLVHQYDGAKMLLNGKVSCLDLVPEADGLQLSSRALKRLTQRPISSDKLLGVSTHSELEVAKAISLGADFILLSPVKKTLTHPDALGMGWEAFQSIVARTPIPVYALGGMKLTDISEAQKRGAQGIAAISELWI